MLNQEIIKKNYISLLEIAKEEQIKKYYECLQPIYDEKSEITEVYIYAKRLVGIIEEIEKTEQELLKVKEKEQKGEKENVKA